MYSLPINLLSYRLLSIHFRICINLVQFIQSTAFCLCVKHAHNLSSVSRVHSDIILSISVASLVRFHVLDPSRSSLSISSILLSIPLTIFTVCSMRLIVWWLLHFIAFGVFLKAISVTSVKSLYHYPVSCMLLSSCVTMLRPSSPNSVNTSSSSFVSSLSPISLITLSTLLRNI